MNQFDHSVVVKVLKGDRITLPKKYLKKYKIKVGDWFAFMEEQTNKRLTLVPVIIVPKEHWRINEFDCVCGFHGFHERSFQSHMGYYDRVEKKGM